MKKLILAACLLGFCSCKVTSGKPPPGNALAGTIDLVFRDATTLYVANANVTTEFFSAGSITVLNASNPTQLTSAGSVTTSLFNSRMALDEVNVPGRLFVSNRLSDNDLDFSDSVFVYDTTNPTAPVLLQTLPMADDPFGIAIIPAGAQAGWVLVTHLSLGVVKAFDGNNLATPIENINLLSQFYNGMNSSAVAVAPDGSRAVVTNISQNLLYILDLTPPDQFTLEAVLQIRFQGLFANDFRDVIWLDNTRFAVANRSSDQVFFFDLATIDGGGPLPDDSVVEELQVDVPGNSATFAVALTPFSDPTPLAVSATHLYVGEFFANHVDSINLTTFVLEEKIFCGGAGPVALRMSPDGLHLYVANQANSSIGIIDTTTDTLAAHFP